MHQHLNTRHDVFEYDSKTSNPLQDGNLSEKEIRQASRGDRNAGG
jgi:hypothetical protein